jgi:hypothetical protein
MIVEMLGDGMKSNRDRRAMLEPYKRIFSRSYVQRKIPKKCALANQNCNSCAVIKGIF